MSKQIDMAVIKISGDMLEQAQARIAALEAEVEKLSASNNSAMPKLPTLEECQTEVQSRIWAGGFLGTSINITECVYKFISRQLSA